MGCSNSAELKALEEEFEALKAMENDSRKEVENLLKMCDALKDGVKAATAHLNSEIKAEFERTKMTTAQIEAASNNLKPGIEDFNKEISEIRRRLDDINHSLEPAKSATSSSSGFLFFVDPFTACLGPSDPTPDPRTDRVKLKMEMERQERSARLNQQPPSVTGCQQPTQQGPPTRAQRIGRSDFATAAAPVPASVPNVASVPSTGASSDWGADSSDEENDVDEEEHPIDPHVSPITRAGIKLYRHYGVGAGQKPHKAGKGGYYPVSSDSAGASAPAATAADPVDPPKVIIPTPPPPAAPTAAPSAPVPPQPQQAPSPSASSFFQSTKGPAGANTLTIPIKNVGAQGLGLKVDVITTVDSPQVHARVSEMRPFSDGSNPCVNAGLQVGDIIVKIDGQGVATTGEFMKKMRNARGTVIFTVNRHVSSMNDLD